MSDPESNKPLGRTVAKFVVNGAISFKTNQFTKNLITDYTRFEKDDLVTNLTAGAVSLVVTQALEPLTEKAVDVTFDFVGTQYKKLKNRKKDDTTE
jgi:hypothetical protein